MIQENKNNTETTNQLKSFEQEQLKPNVPSIQEEIDSTETTNEPKKSLKSLCRLQ